MSNTYAGIGSRQTPGEILDLMTALAAYLAHEGWILRSGHAPGADQAFEAGAMEKAEIYLPWPSFEDQVPIEAEYVQSYPSQAAKRHASHFHPLWQQLSSAAKLLMARDSHQVLGRDLDDPVEAVVCWTFAGSHIGGTAQALRIALRHNIPIFNLALEKDREWADRILHANSV